MVTTFAASCKTCLETTMMDRCLKAETHDETNCGDTSPRLHCCCDKSLSLSLSLRYVAQTKFCRSDNDFHMSHEAICCSNLSRRRVAAICHIVCLGLKVMILLLPFHPWTFLFLIKWGIHFIHFFPKMFTTPLYFSVPTPYPVKSPVLYWGPVLLQFYPHTQQSYKNATRQFMQHSPDHVTKPRKAFLLQGSFCTC